MSTGTESLIAALDREYPLIWKHVQRGGYGYLLLTPCRLVKEGPKRLQIATPLRDGGEKLRWVPREKVYESKREAVA